MGSAAAQESSGSDPRQGSGTKSDPYVVGMYTDGSSFYFSPVGLYVEKGDYVKWVIESGGHSTTSYSKGNQEASTQAIPDGAKSWNSGVLKEKGASFTYQFTVEGTYDYYCIPHKTLGMVGRVVCGSPGGPAEGSDPPDAVGSGVMPGSDTIVKEKALGYPYFPSTGGGPLPTLALGGAALFGIGNVYLLSQSDRFSGRYEEDVTDDTEI
ncbi:halocyanin [Halarchaeum acidiphilum MH1-52-1]|uniref:Halocyanin n=1 Tax=Halarchaeum acidiphilum MH1-52-1 TaxID=1261545 RepID=U2YXJ0_9EURY|nr:halocyanin [Halarchaeum acidiphilum MH1-52-1]